MIKRVRSLYGATIERDLEWKDDEIHPYFRLENFIVRSAPGKAFTQMVTASGSPIGAVVPHRSVAAALADLGWEPV